MNSFKARLSVESLESRELLSWGAVPATFSWPSSANVSFNSNARAGTATISNNEVDMYNFVAPRTGTYTLAAGKSGSQVDTLLGVFKMNGARIAGNDDISSTNSDSKVSVYLTGGTKYAFGVTNYTGGSTGGYKWSITGPPLSRSLNNNAGDGITSFASVSIQGNTMTVYLSGLNSSNWYYYDHRVEVKLMDRNNRPIHSGSWSEQFRTGGTFVAGLPSSDTMTRTFDLSGFDLRQLDHIAITLT